MLKVSDVYGPAKTAGKYLHAHLPALREHRKSIRGDLQPVALTDGAGGFLCAAIPKKRHGMLPWQSCPSEFFVELEYISWNSYVIGKL